MNNTNPGVALVTGASDTKDGMRARRREPVVSRRAWPGASQLNEDDGSARLGLGAGTSVSGKVQIESPALSELSVRYGGIAPVPPRLLNVFFVPLAIGALRSGRVRNHRLLAVIGTDELGQK